MSNSINPRYTFGVFIIILVIAVGLFVIWSHGGHGYHLEKKTRLMMDTYVTISAVGPKEITTKAVKSAFRRLQEIDIKFNSLNPKSPIYRFNNYGEAISDQEILDLIEVALKVSEESDGAFDITVAPLLELWKFYERPPRLPPDDDIKNCLKKVGFRHLILSDGKLEKDVEGVKIDLGGIAKGYALSQAVKELRTRGVTSALIDCGGDIYALGKKGKKMWKVGLKDPQEKGLIGYIEVEDTAVISSGDYERFFTKDGRRYHHIFNPKTGYPTEGVIAVTLIYPEPIIAQAWTKIPFILGAEKGLAMLERIPGMEVIIITSSGEKLYSSGLKHAIKAIPKDDRASQNSFLD